MCEFCKHHKPLLTYHYDSIYTEIKLINKTQLDAMTDRYRSQRCDYEYRSVKPDQLLSDVWTGVIR